jgi:hypothetical protein
MRARRPPGVTLLVFLLWVQAILGIGGGIALILLRHNRSLLDHGHTSASTLLAYGIAVLVIGVITALIATSLGHGSNFARWLVGLVSVLHIAGAIFGLIRIHSSGRFGTLADAAIALIVLYILFGGRGSREFFTGRR